MEMEEKQLAIDVSIALANSVSIKSSTVEGQQSVTDVSSTSAYSSMVVEKQPAAKLLTSSKHWTSIDSTTESENEGFVRVFPGKKVHKYVGKEIKLLRQIAEGGQGTIHTAQLYDHNVDTGEYKLSDQTVVAKMFKGRNCGQWPEQVFGLHVFNQYICQFYGYYLDGDSFYLLMTHYNCSLRDVLDKQVKDNSQTPLPDFITLYLIIAIALGMEFLHEQNIMHRDLKADNVFVDINPDNGIPTLACIGDFDISSNVVGTLFWRAPEVLRALKDGTRPVFTPKSDVYSYAMTCYEILTGNIPFEGARASNYDIVLSGERPELPSDLNPKMKDLMNRCWHQDPDARPTSSDIVGELRELCKELVTGSQSFSKFMDELFDLPASNSLDIERWFGASPESCLAELNARLEVLGVKYNQADFLRLGCEVVADMQEFQSQFGLQSYKEHSVLPFPEWFVRQKLHNSVGWKMSVFKRIIPHGTELEIFFDLMLHIFVIMNEDCIYDNILDDEIWGTNAEIAAEFDAWSEEVKRQILPENRHNACLKFIACNLCESELDPDDGDSTNVKFCLYVDNGSALTRLTTSVVSFFKARIGVLL